MKGSFPFAETVVKIDNMQEHRKDTETAGEYLKRVRMTCGHTLEDVAQVTKINIRYLDAIEHDEFSKIPGDTFLQGFLRSYTRFLCIDEKEITGKIKEIKRPDTQLLNIPSVEGYEKEKGKGFQLSPKKLKIILTSAGGFIVVLLLIVFLSGGRERSTVQSSKNVYDAGSAAVVAEPEQKRSVPVAVSVQPLVLRAYAKELTWMQANIDGKDINETLLKPGEEISWKGQEKIIITVGNAGGIDLEINGKKQEPLGKSGSVVKGVVVTSAGIERQAEGN